MEAEYHFPNLTSTLQITGCHLGNYPANWSYPIHHHFLFELLYCKEGRVWQTVGNSSFFLDAGDWLLIKSGVSHTSENRSDQSYVIFNLHFDIDDPLVRSTLCEFDYLIVKSDEPIHDLLSKHLVELETATLHMNNSNTNEYQTAISRLVIQSHTLGLVALFVRHCIESTMKDAINTSKVQQSTVFETKIAYAIEEKLRNRHHHSIEEIASMLGMSRGQCTRIFSQVYGLSPRQYVSKLVLNEAKQLLVTTTLTMEEISERLGFQSASHFSRQFRRWTGVSPTTFRPKYSRSKHVNNQ